MTIGITKVFGRFFRLEYADQVTDKNVRVGLLALLYEGVCSQLMDTLTSGAFLVAFALLMGASNTVVGLMAAVSPLTQLLQVPAIYLVDRSPSRKTLVVLSSLLSRVAWLVVAIIPWVFPSQQWVDVLLICLFLYFGLGTISACGFNPWIRDFVPQQILGRYFGKRMAIGTAVASVLALLAGMGLELGKRYLPSEFVPYSVLFLVGGIIGLSGVYFLSKVPEPKAASQRGSGLIHAVGQPFRDLNFRRLLIFLGILFVAINLSGPFYAVYMIKSLDLSMSLVIGLAVLSQTMSVVTFRIWGSASDKYSNKSVLLVSGYMYIIAALLWPFLLISKSYLFMIPMLITVHMLTGISAAGLNLCTANIALKAAPQGKATAFLAMNTVVHGATAATAPIIGGIIADALTSGQLSEIPSWLSSKISPLIGLAFSDLLGVHSLFIITALIGLYSMRSLRRVTENGDINTQIVLGYLLSQCKKAVRDIFGSAGFFSKLRARAAEKTVSDPDASLGLD